MVGYRNFGVAIYFTTRCLASITSIEEFEKEFSFLEKHLKISKVYLETTGMTWIPRRNCSGP